MEHFTHCCFIQFMMSDKVCSDESCALYRVRLETLMPRKISSETSYMYLKVCDVQMRNGPPRILEEFPKAPAAFSPKGT